MMQQITYTLAAALSTTVMICPTYANDWLTDLDEAKAKARAENKAILVDFTGSDWCGWCVQLRTTILDTEAFRSYAADKFVLLEVDVPKNIKKIGKKQHARNREIVRKYNISIYPSLLVLNANGEVLGGMIGGRDTLKSVIAPLDEALQNEQKAAAARKLSGTERAQALMAIYSALPPTLKDYFRSMRDEIAQYDPDNTTGIHNEISDTQQKEELQAALNAAGMDFRRAYASAQESIAKASPENKYVLLGLLSDYLQHCQNNLVMQIDDTAGVEELRQLLLLMAECAPEDEATALRQEIELQFKNPDSVLQIIRAKRQK
ncbi:MAG: thioredoxin family protein [Akkermansia sp.]|nr:thioredoxin family protein [Akkermansia sp.]